MPKAFSAAELHLHKSPDSLCLLMACGTACSGEMLRGTLFKSSGYAECVEVRVIGGSRQPRHGARGALGSSTRSAGVGGMPRIETF